METTERHASLTITGVSKEDSGPYQLVLENEVGSDSAIITIVVKDVPAPPGPVTILNELTQGTSVTLSWLPPKYDGGSPIVNYQVEKKELPNTTWIRCGNSKYTQDTISTLLPGKEYQFRVLAENFYGKSDPSPESAVVKTPSTERIGPNGEIIGIDGEVIPVKRRRFQYSGQKVQDYDRFCTFFSFSFFHTPFHFF